MYLTEYACHVKKTYSIGEQGEEESHEPEQLEY